MNSTYSNVLTCEITRKVARSKSTTSSAAHIALKSVSCAFSNFTFGISECTISDQALYNVSSHIDVGKQFSSKLLQHIG